MKPRLPMYYLKKDKVSVVSSLLIARIHAHEKCKWNVIQINVFKKCCVGIWWRQSSSSRSDGYFRFLNPAGPSDAKGSSGPIRARMVRGKDRRVRLSIGQSHFNCVILVCGQRPKTKDLLEFLLLLFTFWFISSFFNEIIFFFNLADAGLESLTFCSSVHHSINWAAVAQAHLVQKMLT